jgi:hypothetical protein
VGVLVLGIALAVASHVMGEQAASRFDAAAGGAIAVGVLAVLYEGLWWFWLYRR